MTEYRLLKPLLVEQLYVTVEPPHERKYHKPMSSITIDVQGMASAIEVLFDLDDAIAAGIVVAVPE